MSKPKALIHDLGSSVSFGRLSLKGKILWPMLIIRSDDQGRGLAEPDRIKWHVCANVDEIDKDDIVSILQEMASDGIDLIHLYQDSRGRQLYQLIRWWEPDIGSGSKLQWAQPSEYEAPEGWTDRIRIQRHQAEPHVANWSHPGGFATVDPGLAPPTPIPSELGSELPSEQGRGLTKHKTIQPNSTGKQQQQQQNGAPAPDAADAVALMSVFDEYGMNDAETVAAEAAPHAYTVGEMRRLFEYADERGLGCGWVREQIRQGKRAPPKREKSRRRFVEGEYAEFVEH